MNGVRRLSSPFPRVLAVLFCLAGTVVHAAPSKDGSPGPLTLQRAIELTLATHPALAVAEYDESAARARIRQAQFGAQTEVALEFENFAGSGELEGTDGVETTLQLSRALELGDRRRRRVAVAEAERDQARAGVEATRLELATETALRFVAVLAAQEQTLAARRLRDLAGTILEQAQRRVAAGNALSAEVHRARAGVGSSELLVLQARAQQEVAWQRLTAPWDRPETGGMLDEVPPGSPPGSVAGDLFTTPPVEPLPALLNQLAASPQIARLATTERLREAERTLARAQARPDVVLSLGLRHLAEPDDLGLVAGVALPLGNRARSRAAVAEREALIRQAAAETDALRLDLATTAGRLHREIELRRRSLAIIERDILPAAEAALEQIGRGYRLGRLSYGEYALASREALDAQLERVRIATEFHQLLMELEGLTGTSL